MAPIATYHVESAIGGDTSSLSTPSFTPSAGEVIVVKATTWSTSTPCGTPSGGSLTYTSRVVGAPGGFHSYGEIFTTTVGASPGSMTVTLSPPAGFSHHDMTVERWANVTLAATPNTVAASGAASAPSASIVTSAGSIITWCNGDESSNDPTGRTYLSGATEDGLGDGHIGSNAVFYHAYQTAGGAGSQTVGMSVPSSQAWNLVGIELLTSASFSVAISDSATATDTVTRTLTMPRAVSDTAAASDTVARAESGSRLVSDSASAVDTIIRSVSSARSIADSATASDTVTRLLGTIRSISDSATATDTVTRNSESFARSLVDSATATDTIITVMSATRLISDTASASDTITTKHLFGRIISDTASANDTLGTRTVFFRNISDAVAAVDSIHASFHPIGGIATFTYHVGAPLTTWTVGNPTSGGGP